MPLKRYTASDLAAHDGSSPDKPILLSIQGTIYDVTRGKMFYGPQGETAARQERQRVKVYTQNEARSKEPRRRRQPEGEGVLWLKAMDDALPLLPCSLPPFRP